jgi:hypothetical protein
MTTRTVTGTIYHADGTAWAGAVVTFRLYEYFVTATGTNPIYDYTVTASAGGVFTATLAVPDTGAAAYRVTFPSTEIHYFNLASGAATTLESILAAGVVSGTQANLQTLIDTHAALTIGVHGLTVAPIPYGGFYMEDGSTQVTLTNQDGYYPITSGMSAGSLSGMTFASGSQLVVATAGTYMLTYSLTAQVNAASQNIEAVIMGGASGLTVNVKTNSSTEFITSGRYYHLAGSGFMVCAAGDIIRLACENETSGGKQLTINHANLTAWRIGP